MSHQLIHPQLSLLVVFLPSLVATCIFKTCLQFTAHWPFITHVDDLPSHFIVNNNLISPSAALYHDNHSFCITVLPPWLSFFLRSALVLLHFPSVAHRTLQGLFCSHVYPGPHFLESTESHSFPTSLFS